jgi:prepilin-type N-terminal cleavage/methylation domain-containing protein
MTMKKRRGFSLVEVLISLSILSMVLTGSAMLTISAGRSFDLTSAQLDAGQSASQAVQHMMLDLEEAKQVTVSSTTSLRVFFPQVDASGNYIRSALDTVNTVDYFRGNSDGTANTAGTCLVRQPAGGTARVVGKGVTNVQFTSTNPSSVDITLDTQRSTYISSAQCNMVHLAIFLRNY